MGHDAHLAERLRRRTIAFLATDRPWGVDEDVHPTRLDPVEAELEVALERRDNDRTPAEPSNARRKGRLARRDAR